MQLFEHAKSLAARRLKDIPTVVFDVTRSSAGLESATSMQCGTKLKKLPQQLNIQLGVHQPPGHKAPLD